MDGCTLPYRMDRNTNGSGIALYVIEDIPSRQISFKNDDKDIEHFFVEINLRKKKSLISCSCNRHLQFIDKHLTRIGEGLDSLWSKYDDYISMGEKMFSKLYHYGNKVIWLSQAYCYCIKK